MTDATAVASPTPAPNADVVSTSVAPVVADGTVTAPSIDPNAPAPVDTTTSSTETPPEKTVEADAGAPSPESPAADTAAAVETTQTPEGEAPPAESAQHQYTDFTIPEGMKFEDAKLSAAKNIFGKYNLTQEAGQEFVDFGSQMVNDAVSAERQHQQDVFAETTRKWSKQIDKEFGNRRDTVLKNANWVLSTFGGDKQQIQALNEALGYTGAGNHPALVRLLNNISRKLKEREAPSAVPSKTDNKNVPAYDRRYGGARA